MSLYKELAPLGAHPGGDVGGDGQLGESWSRRFFRALSGERYALITVYFYVEEVGDAQQVTRATEYLLCTSLTDPGGTEQYANYHYEPVDVPGEVSEAAAKYACTTVAAREFTWDGFPRSENECVVYTHEVTQNMVRIRCEAHDCYAQGTFHDGSEAVQSFECDRGHRWAFLLHYYHDEDPPILSDLTGLCGSGTGSPTPPSSPSRGSVSQEPGSGSTRSPSTRQSWATPAMTCSARTAPGTCVSRCRSTATPER